MKTANEYYREKFGCKVYKLSLDGGFTCPNRDGTLGYGGCRFCSPSGGGDFAERQFGSISEQLERAKRRVESKNKGGKYIAYFQSYTGTYAPVEILREKFTAAMAPEDIVGLAVGTRPDCLPNDVIALLAELNARKPVSVELGLQTAQDTTAEYLHRGYRTDVYIDAVKRLKDAGIEVVTHIILGLPGETAETAVKTTETAVNAGTDGVKFHLLHVLKSSELENDYREGRFRCLSLEEYGQWLQQCIAVLPEKIVVHRITGDGAKRDLIAPTWSGDKKRVLNYLKQLLKC